MNSEKKKKNMMIVMVAAVALILIGVIAYFLVSNVANNDNNNNNNNNGEKVTSSEKADSTKEWIYDATYEYDVPGDSYTASWGTTESVSNIAAPFINSNSTDAKSTNQEIKELFDDCIEIYTKCYNGNKDCYVNLWSITHFDESVMSLAVIKVEGSTSIPTQTYKVYNFDMSTMNLMSNAEVYKYAEFTDDNIEGKVDEAITQYLEGILSGYKYDDNESFATFKEVAVNNYKETVENKTVQYFITENKALNLVINIPIPYVSSNLTTITVE